MERRIAAILAADMVGFSRLMEADEIGTLERQKAFLTESIDPRIVAHGGTVIKLTGDGLIAEFPSAVEAVKCAVSFQTDMFDREIDEPEERRISYRVAINLGDVIFDEGDIYGDGVNIAARLEALAEPGGIVVSGATYDMLKNQVSVGYKSLGEKHLKNIETPVRVYQVIDTPKGSPSQSGKRLSKLVVAATIAAVVLIVGLFFWWPVQPSITAADPAMIAFSLPEKPSIAVAPFASASGGSLSSSLSEGLVASLISTLTTSSDIVVISPQSMSDMRDRSIAQIAEKYGVQYVVDGSVQVNQEKLRVTVRLSDALNGRSIWSDQWDRGTNDVFAVQDEITEKVFEELQVKLTLGEEARTLRDKLGTFENVQDWLEGREHFHAETMEGLDEAERIWRQILRRNPELAGPNELLSQIYFQRWLLKLPSRMGQQREARRYIDKAIEIGGDGKTYAYLGLQQFFVRWPKASDVSEAYASIEYALKLNPGDPEVLFYGGMVFAHGDRLEQGIEMMQRGLRLQPYHPPWVVGELCHALYQAGRFDEARDIALGVVASETKTKRPLARCLGVLAAISVENGDLDEARAYVSQIVEVVPLASTRYYLWTLRLNSMGDQRHVEKFLNALRSAGLE